jgi:hypothetical protein
MIQRIQLDPKEEEVKKEMMKRGMQSATIVEEGVTMQGTVDLGEKDPTLMKEVEEEDVTQGPLVIVEKETGIEIEGVIEIQDLQEGQMIILKIMIVNATILQTKKEVIIKEETKGMIVAAAVTTEKIVMIVDLAPPIVAKVEEETTSIEMIQKKESLVIIVIHPVRILARVIRKNVNLVKIVKNMSLKKSSKKPLNSTQRMELLKVLREWRFR